MPRYSHNVSCTETMNSRSSKTISGSSVSARSDSFLVSATTVSQIPSSPRSSGSIGDKQPTLAIRHCGSYWDLSNPTNGTRWALARNKKIIPVPNSRRTRPILNNQKVFGLDKITVIVNVHWACGIGCTVPSSTGSIRNKRNPNIISGSSVSSPSSSPDTCDDILGPSDNIRRSDKRKKSLNFVSAQINFNYVPTHHAE